MYGNVVVNMRKIVEVECNICHTKFDDLDKFDKHWEKEHLVLYGYACKYPTIRVYNK